MVQHSPGCGQEMAAEPTKKVTFSRAAVSVKERKPQQTQTKSLRSVEDSAVHRQPAMPHHNTSSNSRGSERTRPHNKMTVVGVSLKTRLHCNHLMPKCKSSSKSNRKNILETKHVVQGDGVQRTVLSSCRVLPRGEINGRKIYQNTEDSVSICDATWRPIPNESENFSKTNSKINNHMNRNEDERVFKKKLRFEDQVTECNESCNPGQTTDSAKNSNTNENQKQEYIQPSSYIQEPSTNSRTNSNRYSERKTKETSADYCKLCEEPDKEYLNGSCKIKKKDKVHRNHNETNSSELSLERDHFSSHNELCFLCHKYRNHKCQYGEEYCRLCDASLHCSQEAMTEGEHSLHLRESTSAHIAGGEKQHIPLTRIPYEPRTKFVKNLKEKLETTYKDKSNQKRKSVAASAALPGTQSHQEPQQHHTAQAEHRHHGKKCLHHYQQNNRLFLEPTITNSKGQSVCIECGVSQPRDPDREPFIYHITLGGMKTSSQNSHGFATGKPFFNRGRENSRACNMKSKRMTNNVSKFLYTKLNDNINNIFGRNDLHSAFSRPSPPLRYPAPSHSKRPPSSSMALMDHLI